MRLETAMSKPEFFVTPGYGERNLKLFHYSQAVKMGKRLELSGQAAGTMTVSSAERIPPDVE